MTKKIFFSFTSLVLVCFLHGQVGIGTTMPHSGSVLDLTAADKALLVTRVFNVSAITSPTNGMIVYDLSLNCIRGYQNGVWSDCGFVNFSSGAASSSPVVCINTVMPVITHTTSGATGIGTPTGLPPGVTASWANATITISGTPTSSGVFNYTIPLAGGSIQAIATGTITVNPNNTVTAANSSPYLLVNTALPTITHTTTVATGIGTATGLPAGVTAAWVSNTITISGTPTADGTFNYSIPLTGGCGTVNATGSIVVLNAATVTSTSGRIWLDRNLGATQVATSRTDHLAYGDLYQWGRRADGHQRITWTNGTSGSPVNGTTTIRPQQDQAATPLFIIVNTGNLDWRGAQNNNLWQGVAGINNPCPSGFRVPTSVEFTAEFTAYSITNSATAFSSPFKFTAGPGYRIYNSGALASVGSTGFYWSSSVSGTSASFLSIGSGGIGVLNTSRATGFAVRCIKN